MRNINSTDLMSDDDLITALFDRFDSALFIADRKMDSERFDSQYETKGNYYSKLGLAQTILDVIKENRPVFNEEE